MFFLKNRSSSIYRFFTILSLIVAGEAVFVLPFHITRFFRPTFMEVFGFTHSQLGFAQGMYGLMAMLAYFPGGFLADKFQARNLIVLSLLTTALSGLSLLSIPGFVATCFLWAFWGLSTILFLWAALIKAIREWASKDEQAFGYALLDSGRGLYAIILASLSVGIFTNYLPEDLSMSSDQQRLVSLQSIIYFYILTTLGSALLVWVFVPASHGKKIQANTQVDFWQTTKTIVKMPQCWLISFIVISSYIAWKGLDNIGLYLKDVYGYTEVEAAWLSTYSAWTRIVAAIASGLIADRLTPSSVILRRPDNDIT